MRKLGKRQQAEYNKLSKKEKLIFDELNELYLNDLKQNRKSVKRKQSRELTAQRKQTKVKNIIRKTKKNAPDEFIITNKKTWIIEPEIEIKNDDEFLDFWDGINPKTKKQMIKFLEKEIGNRNNVWVNMGLQMILKFETHTGEEFEIITTSYLYPVYYKKRKNKNIEDSIIKNLNLLALNWSEQVENYADRNMTQFEVFGIELEVKQ